MQYKISGIIFPKFNILLLNGKKIFNNAFTCFLDKVYNFKLYHNNNNTIQIPVTDECKCLLQHCLEEQFFAEINTAKKIIKTSNIYCNIVLYFNLLNLEEKQEIFEFLDKKIIHKHVNILLSSLKKKKIFYYVDKNKEYFSFTEDLTTLTKLTGNMQETLSIISFNFA